MATEGADDTADFDDEGAKLPKRERECPGRHSHTEHRGYEIR
ncbi:MAG: hypothetical protein ACLTK0_01595 [Anaerovoracaceae bacterium]